MTLEQAVKKLGELEKASYAIGHAQSVLSVDGDTVAPKNSWKGRGKALAYLGELTYRQMVNPETGEMLETILQHREETDEVTFRRAEVLKEEYDELHVLPMEEYVAWQELTNEAGAVWHEAKVKSDYAMFAPYLEKIIASRRRFASLKNPAKPAYDVLVDQYEKGAYCMDGGHRNPSVLRNSSCGFLDLRQLRYGEHRELLRELRREKAGCAT